MYSRYINSSINLKSNYFYIKDQSFRNLFYKVVINASYNLEKILYLKTFIY